MHICGIICEYNPFHRGHEKQLRQVRQALGADAAIVCLMSGSFVQRGEPAILKSACARRRQFWQARTSCWSCR